jgi:hypothetical protein
MSQQINLFNPLFLKQKKYFSARTMLQGLALILAALVLFQIALVLQLRMLEGQKLETLALHTQVQQQMLQASSAGPRTRSKLLEDEIERTEGMIRAQQDALKIFEGGNFGNSDGYSGFLAALARERLDGLWLTGFTVSGGGEELSIRGRVLRPDLVPQYIRRLNEQPVMRGHAIAELTMVRVEEPAVEATPGAPVQAEVPRRYVEFALSTGKGGDKSEIRP